MTGIEITSQPEVTRYGTKDDKDLTGLVVSAVFSNGNKEQVYDYTVSGFTTDQMGEKTVTVTYHKMQATFPIYVAMIETVKLGEKNVTLTVDTDAKTDTKTVTVTTEASEEIPEDTYVFVAVYDENHRFLGIERIKGTSGTVSLSDSAEQLMIFWLNKLFAPQCKQATTNLG
jgi:hypothetical protein